MSRGDVTNPKENEATDVIEIKRYSVKPETPVCISPIEAAKVNSRDILLIASEFKAPDDSQHGETHLQVARTYNFANPDVDIWTHHEDWYAGKNLNEGINLTQRVIPSLKSKTTYYWRVRYRTKNLVWSDWSESQKFVTK